jgi:hypothetical protein
MQRLACLRLACVLLALASAPAWAQSIVRGWAIAQEDSDLPLPRCPEGALCSDVWVRWILKPTRTLAGPPLAGRIRAVAMQHTRFTPEYMAHMRLFVLDPIMDPQRREALHADYYLLEYTTKRSTICTWRTAAALGLDEADARKVIPGNAIVEPDGTFVGSLTVRCFKVRPPRRR